MTKQQFNEVLGTTEEIENCDFGFSLVKGEDDDVVCAVKG
jgi:hypothetical protein